MSRLRIRGPEIIGLGSTNWPPHNHSRNRFMTTLKDYVPSVIGMALAVMTIVEAPAAASGGEDRDVTTISDFGDDGRIGGEWNAATKTIAFGRTQKDGHFHTFLADGDGRNERRLTFAAWQDNRHQFPAAWHPGGKYLVMLVEKNEHERTSTDAIPGYGAYTDYWLITADSKQAWMLYDLPKGYDHAITHAAFSPDGSKFVWTERVKAPQVFDMNLFAGAYVFNVSDFVATPEPHLANRGRSCRAALRKAGKSNPSPAITKPSPSTAPTLQRTSSPRAFTRWTLRAARFTN